MTLSILEHASMDVRSHNSAGHIHRVVEAIKLASADREATFGDPVYVDVPMDRMLSTEYTAGRFALIDADRASLDMRPGIKSAVSRLASTSPPAQPVRAETSVVCVVDRDRNAFVSTPSEGAGGGSILPELGLVPSRRGRGSVLASGHPAEARAGHRPRMTNGPSMFVKPGEWIMPVASPGSDNQMQAVLQVVLNVLRFDFPLQAAVEAPRVTTHSFPGTFEPHTERPGSLFLEGRIPDIVAAELRRKGHRVEWWGDWGPPSDHTDISTVCAVRAASATGLLEGAADPRRPSAAVGR
jgi:gamma-glutamyltranspeptidase/glutathione hydrolase